MNGGPARESRCNTRVSTDSEPIEPREVRSNVSTTTLTEGGLGGDHRR